MANVTKTRKKRRTVPQSYPVFEKTTTERSTPKEAALDLVSRLPEDVCWEQLKYHLDVREEIEHALIQVEDGELLDGEEVFDELLRDLKE